MDIATATEPEMEHYLRTCGWFQAKYYHRNWYPSEEQWYIVHLIKEAVRIQMNKDLSKLKLLKDRLSIIGINQV